MDDIYIRKVCEGDTEAFRYFLKHYKDMAFSLAISIVKDEYEAEEVVQDAFIKAFNGLKSFNRKSKFSTWFYRIVLNEAFACIRKLKKQPVSLHSDYSYDIADESIPESLQEDEQAHLINEALKNCLQTKALF